MIHVCTKSSSCDHVRDVWSVAENNELHVQEQGRSDASCTPPNVENNPKISIDPSHPPAAAISKAAPMSPLKVPPMESKANTELHSSGDRQAGATLPPTPVGSKPGRATLSASPKKSSGRKARPGPKFCRFCWALGEPLCVEPACLMYGTKHVAILQFRNFSMKASGK